MRIYEDPCVPSPSDFSNPIATVGVFDGMHVGHVALISELRAWAAQGSRESVVITFRAHPRAVVADSGPTHLMSLQHRLMLLEREGVDACLLLAFTPELAATGAEEFAREYLKRRLGATGLLMGFDSRLGRGGEGTPETMREIGARLGFEVRTVGAVEIDGAAVSSTRIREHVLAGELAKAARMLGRPVTLLGTVVRGEGRGRKLGFPTANLDLHHEARPPAGVYGAIAVVGEKEAPALVSIGKRPTFHAPEADETIEVHIPEFHGDLYGRDMEVRFLAKIRDQQAFDSAEELVKAMREDSGELKRIIGEAGG
jgi:riboflavin kinase/FMN adenylyltransferase